MDIKNELMHELWKQNGGRCALCRKSLSLDNMVIDNIFPKHLVGTDDKSNMQLLCQDCSVKKSNRRLSERDFQQYIKKLLKSDERFINVESDVRWSNAHGQNMMFDLVFNRKNNEKEQLFIIEVKTVTAPTASRMTDAINQIQIYQRSVPEAQFILAIPTNLASEYQDKLKQTGILLWDQKILSSGIPDNALPHLLASDTYDLLKKLHQCPPGWKDWIIYQKLVGDILEIIFCPPLESPVEQNADANYANRRDFILSNYSEHGYWRHLRERYQAEFILVDAKNSENPVTKEDILQVSHYLKEKGLGMFGLIFCRTGINEKGMDHLRDIWQNENKMLLVLNDNDVEQMLLSKQNDIDPSRLLMEKIQEFRQKI